MPSPLADLTEREVQVLTLLPTCSRMEIAETLFITHGTVKNHITNIFRKLGVNNRRDAIRLWDEHGPALYSSSYIFQVSHWRGSYTARLIGQAVIGEGFSPVGAMKNLCDKLYLAEQVQEGLQDDNQRA